MKPPAAYSTAIGSIEAKRPRLPRSTNFTRPVTLAKSVSSEPTPTFVPALIRVPRCRTMIDPPVMTCPANAFTPSRCAFESRPFVELPPPFLCAITESSFKPRAFSRQLSADVIRCIPVGKSDSQELWALSRLAGCLFLIGHAVGHNGLDANLSEILPVPRQLLVLLLPLEMEDQHLVAAPLAKHLGRNLRTSRPGQLSRLAGNRQHVAELHRPILRRDGLDLQHVSGRNPVLLPSRAYHCVHSESSSA